MTMAQYAGRLSSRWDQIRTSYWFLPSVMAVAAVGLAVLTLWIDQRFGSRLLVWQPWLTATGAEGARSVLSTVAGSMITVAGVVFSITIVALTLASSQFGPRLLRNFMRDRGNQIVLGTFIAVFLYCLIVLRMVGLADGKPFTPHVSVVTSLALAVCSLGVLIYFVHHVSRSLQSSHIVGTIARQIEAELPTLFPESLGRGAEDRSPRVDELSSDPRPIHRVEAKRDGYVRAIEDDGLMDLARREDLRIHLRLGPGSMVVRGCVLAEVVTDANELEPILDCIEACFVLGDQRTSVQDLSLLFEELAEIAVRALSPGVNDPQTATECIDGITRGLSRLVDRAFPSPLRHDEDGVLRVVTPALAFEDFLAVSLDPIRRHARADPSVLAALLSSLAEITRRAPSDAHRTALRELGDEILEAAGKEIASGRDRRLVQEAHRRAFEGGRLD